jgi:hypothetical protein
LGESSNSAGAQQACTNAGGVFTTGSCDLVAGCPLVGAVRVGCCTADNTVAAPYTCSMQEVTSTDPSSVSSTVQADCTGIGGTFASTDCNVAFRCESLNPGSCLDSPCVSHGDCLAVCVGLSVSSLCY